jgi:AcrR family transcriptional regulator
MMVRTVKKPEERRMEIVKAARFLFQRNNFDQTTMQDVINSLGIAKGTVYYYFSSKEELLAAVIDDIVEKRVAQMQQLVDQSNGNALEKIRLLVAAGDIAETHDELLEQLHRSANSGMHVSLLAAAVQKQAPLYARLFEQGNAEGLFQVDAPLESAEFVLSALQFLTDQGIAPWTQETLIRRILAFPTLVERILKAQPGSFQFLIPQILNDGETNE